jgi:hypothetical protein
MWSKLNKVAIAIFVVLFTAFGIQSSYADPGRRLEINVNALTYANQNPTNLTLNSWWGFSGLTDKAYRIFGVSEGDTLIFNASNVSDIGSRNLYDIVGYFNGNSGFTINFFKNNAAVSYDSFTYNGINGYKLDENANLDSYRLEVTLGSDPVLQGFNSIGPVLGAVGFPSLSTSEYYSWELHSSGQWAGSSPAPAPAPVYVRQTSNLLFEQSLYASDTLSDPDGQLRKTVDQIMNKYGSLIK